MIFTQIKQTINKLGSQNAEHEALLSFDFNKLSLKEALMRLCFSPLANWILIVWMFILFFNPFRYEIQLLKGSAALLSFLYAPVWTTGLVIGIISSYFLRSYLITIAIILYFVSQSEIHTILGCSIIFGVFIGEILRRFKLGMSMKSQCRKIYLYYTGLQFIALCLSLFFTVNLYQFMDYSGMFSRTLFAYRFEFICLSVVIHFLLQFFINGVWGHFYSNLSFDPSEIQLRYSTAICFSQLNLNRRFKGQITELARTRLVEIDTQFSEAEFKARFPEKLKLVVAQEKSFLQTIV